MRPRCAGGEHRVKNTDAIYLNFSYFLTCSDTGLPCLSIFNGTFQPAVLGPLASNPLFSVVFLFASRAASFSRHALMAHNDVRSKQPTKTAITGGKGLEQSPRAFITGPDSQIAARSPRSSPYKWTSCTRTKGARACMPKATGPTWRA